MLPSVSLKSSELSDKPIYNSMWNNVVNAWWPLIFYPATDAPKFHKGMIAMMCICIATLGVTWLVWFLERREWRLYGKPGETERHTDSKNRPQIHSEERENSGFSTQ
jgi:MFS transporter, ACS family, pantothenate transporter